MAGLLAESLAIVEGRLEILTVHQDDLQIVDKADITEDQEVVMNPRFLPEVQDPAEVILTIAEAQVHLIIPEVADLRHRVLEAGTTELLAVLDPADIIVLIADRDHLATTAPIAAAQGQEAIAGLQAVHVLQEAEATQEVVEAVAVAESQGLVDQVAGQAQEAEVLHQEVVAVEATRAES